MKPKRLNLSILRTLTHLTEHSANSLYRVFRRHRSYTPMQFLRDVRLRRVRGPGPANSDHSNPLLALTYSVNVVAASLPFPVNPSLASAIEAMNKSPIYLAILSALAASPSAAGAEASLVELRQRCQDARESKIAPLREAAIEECVANRRSSRTREDCERRNRDFGQGGPRAPMFIDLPECVEYFEAQDRQRDRSSRR